MRRTKEAIELLDMVLEEAADKIHRLGNRFRSVGIGDTETDEAIADEFYGLIH